MAVIVLASTTTTSETLGAGPRPFSKLRVAPETKPEPVIVTNADEPTATEFGEIALTPSATVTGPTAALGDATPGDAPVAAAGVTSNTINVPASADTSV